MLGCRLIRSQVGQIDDWQDRVVESRFRCAIGQPSRDFNVSRRRSDAPSIASFLCIRFCAFSVFLSRSSGLTARSISRTLRDENETTCPVRHFGTSASSCTMNRGSSLRNLGPHGAHCLTSASRETELHLSLSNNIPSYKIFSRRFRRPRSTGLPVPKKSSRVRIIHLW
jgi:hypothetical protein